MILFHNNKTIYIRRPMYVAIAIDIAVCTYNDIPCTYTRFWVTSRRSAHMEIKDPYTYIIIIQI